MTWSGGPSGTLEAWEYPEASHEDEAWGQESVLEDESFEYPELAHESWESPEATLEDESWEYPEASHESWETFENPEERDQFLPFLLPLAAKALPFVARAAMPAIKRLLPMASRAVGSVVRSVLAPPSRPGGPVGSGMPGLAQAAAMQRARLQQLARRRAMARYRAAQMGGSPSMGGAPSMGGGEPSGPSPMGGGIPPELIQLLQRLSGALAQGESNAELHESQMFGESNGELAAHEGAHEAALAEVLAAEASHTASQAEASALLGASLPIVIRVMGARRLTRPVLPALATANTRLVRGIRSSGPGGRQLLRTVPTIQRRTIATLDAIQRSGRPVTPNLVAPVVAAQAARVLRTPRICGSAIARNVAVRRATVAPGAR